jgi:peptidoglycan/LPS O-acetylase OafA/YrhL
MRIELPKTFDLTLVIRGLAASFVIYWHLIGTSQATSILSFFNVPGRAAVWLFFVLSGYLIAYGFVYRKYDGTQHSVKKFYSNRILRVYPLFLFTSLVSLALALYFNKQLDFSLKFLLQQFFVLQWTHEYPLSGVFWTLGIEMQFYLIAPFLLLYQLSSPSPLRRGLFVYLSLLTVPFIFHFVFSYSWDNRTLLGNLAHFQIGVLGCLARSHAIEKFRNNANKIALLSFALAILSLTLCAGMYHYLPRIFWVGLGGVILDLSGFMFIICHIMLELKKIPLNSFTKLLSALGVLSYGLYAWHSVISQYFKIFQTNFALNFAFSLLLATLTYLAVEKPALRLRRP